MVVEAQVAQQHAAREDQGRGVGLVLALDVEADVAAAGLEDGHVAAHVAAGDDAGAADEGGANVGQDAAVQVGHDHDVKLLGARDGLHGGVVDNHVVDLERGVLLGDRVEGAAEQAVGQLHDVGLVDARHLGAAVGEGEGKGELGDALRLGAGDDLEGLDDARDALVLEARVLALGVLADDAQVDVLVARLVAGDVLDEGDAGVDVELLAHGHVEALVAGPADGRVQDALEAQLVALERRHRLAEGVLGATGAHRVDARDLDLLPLDGHIVRLEDGLDRLGHLGADAVAGDQRHRVLAAELGRLEDVGLDRREGPGGEMLRLAGSGSGGTAQDLLERTGSALAFSCSVLADVGRSRPRRHFPLLVRSSRHLRPSRGPGERGGEGFGPMPQPSARLAIASVPLPRGVQQPDEPLASVRMTVQHEIAGRAASAGVGGGRPALTQTQTEQTRHDSPALHVPAPSS